MEFEKRFESVEEFLIHTDEMMTRIDDPLIQQKYIGFITVSAVTVYELAIKDIIYRFSDQKHKILGSFTRSVFGRMNGRIKLSDLRENHISRFGEKYVKKFNNILEITERNNLAAEGGSIISSYGNVIRWRNTFAHGGEIPTTTNYQEVKDSYMRGKKIIYCLDGALYR